MTELHITVLNDILRTRVNHTSLLDLEENQDPGNQSVQVWDTLCSESNSGILTGCPFSRRWVSHRELVARLLAIPGGASSHSFPNCCWVAELSLSECSTDLPSSAHSIPLAEAAPKCVSGL